MRPKSVIFSLYFLSLVGFSVLTSAATDRAFKDGPVEATLKILKVGAGIECIVTLDIKPKWHVYGRSGGSEGQQPLSLELELPAGVQSESDWIWPQAQILYEKKEIEIFEGVQVFKRNLKIISEQQRPVIRVKVSFQACTSDVCTAPREVELTASLAGSNPAEQK